jgi:Flp pilus assembly protein TadD
MSHASLEAEALLDGPEPAAGIPAARGGGREAGDRLTQLGMALTRRGDFPGAVARFTAALKLDPTNALLYSRRGAAYRLQGEYERAIADFHVALRLSPSAPGALVGRAVAYHLSGRAAARRRGLQRGPGPVPQLPQAN